MPERNLRAALHHGQVALNTASYGFLSVGAIFFVLGSQGDPPFPARLLSAAVLLVVLPGLGVLGTLALGLVDQSMMSISRASRNVLFSVPGLVACVPFLARLGDHAPDTAAQGMGVFWLILYISGVFAVTRSWDELVAEREES